MSARLPPLVSIKAFDATSRQLSVSKAAVELHVTPAAISHQIKELELFLGKTLFNRENRRMTLTEDGTMYAEYVQQAFLYLHEGTGQLMSTTKKSLSVSVTPSFEIYWLILNLSDFYAQYPDIQINISTRHQLGHSNSNSNDNDIDVAIRWGQTVHPALHSELLILNKMIPVCSPQLLKGKHALKQPVDLQHTTILYEVNSQCRPTCSYWSQWLRKATLKDSLSFKKIFFENAYMLIQAAIAGHGVALVPEILAKPALLQGSLVQPFNIYLKEISTAYHIVTQRQSGKNEVVTAFVRWIKSKMLCELSTQRSMTPKSTYLAQGIDTSPDRLQQKVRVKPFGENFYDFIDFLPISVFWKNLEGVYLGCNTCFANSVGLATTERVVGKCDFELPVNKNCSLKYIADDKKIIDSKVSMVNIEEVQLFEDGTRKHLLTSKAPLVGKQGEAVGIFGIYSDISERASITN